ncbi:MAG: right-handed parallel beta-helix repeat-containing protein [Thermoplasmata archaeon]|nr:right-handed parallel beta-helix repeat-containing protein [Thermoplasmata archaeon]
MIAVIIVSFLAAYGLRTNNAIAIKVDGIFEDWQGVAKTTKARDGNVPENIDIAEYATADTGKNVAFYAKVYGTILAGDSRYTVETSTASSVYVANQRETSIPNANGRDVAYVFIDTDNNPETGFKPSPNFVVGADKAIEIFGKNGKIEASRVLSFSGAVQQEWAWNIGESVAAATNGKEMETMTGKNLLGTGERYTVYFYMIDWEGKDCRVENALRCDGAGFLLAEHHLDRAIELKEASAEVETKGTPRTPISITSNSGFTAGNGVVGGSGTEIDPYIISGWDINASGYAYGIYIVNTDRYFVIRNCTVWGASVSTSEPYGASIAFKNLKNGGIDNCTLNTSMCGLWLNYSSNIFIKNTNVSNNTVTGGNYGVFINASANITIINSLISYNRVSGNSPVGGTFYRYGMFINTSQNLSLTGTTIRYNGAYNGVGASKGYGLYMSSVKNSTVSSCQIVFNYGDGTSGYTGVGYGVYLTGSENNSFEASNVSNNSGTGSGGSATGEGYGFYIASSNSTILRYNTVTGNSASAPWTCYGYGIYVEVNTNRTEMVGNNVTNNYASSGTTGAYAMGYGIYLSSNYAYIADNNLSENYGRTSNAGGLGFGHGIVAQTSYSTIVNNTITGNNGQGFTSATGRGRGIYLSGSQNFIACNNITGNWGGVSYGTGAGYGIYAYSASNNTIQWNTIRNNYGYAVSGYVGTKSGYGYGLYFDQANNNTIEKNIVTGSNATASTTATAYNLYLYNSTGNTVWMNNISYAYISGTTSGLAAGANLSYAVNNVISTNNVSQAGYGIILYNSSSNILSYNQIALNTYHGIRIHINSTENRIAYNNFWRNNGAGKGVTGNAQAYDENASNYWHDSTAMEGNYWSNWNGNDWGTVNAYPLQGGAGAADAYPIRIPALPPMHVAGNGNLTFTRSLFGWSGDGSSASSPVIINRYYLNANGMNAGASYGIWMDCTGLYVRMSNLTVRNSSLSANFPSGSGIAFENATNGTLTDCNITGCNYGVSIKSSQGIKLTRNYIRGITMVGVYLYSACYVKIENNTVVENAMNGVSLFEASNWNEIKNNTIKLNTFSGITFTDANNNTVVNNNISQNTLYGIHLYASKDNNISANSFYRNAEEAVYLTAGSTRNTLVRNYFIENNGAGRGVVGPCQAYDEVGGNYWYDNGAQEGNYWSNWDGNGWGTASAYPIDGGAGASDWYPIPELSAGCLVVLCFVILGVLSTWAKRRPTKEQN